MRGPAFDRLVWIWTILSRNFAEIVMHPIVHVLHDLPDGVRIARDGSRRELRRNIFDASDRIHMGALAVHELPQCGVAHSSILSSGLTSSVRACSPDQIM